MCAHHVRSRARGCGATAGRGCTRTHAPTHPRSTGSFDFHPKFFEKKLAARPDCRVVGIKKGEKGCPDKHKVGHWVQVTAPARTNDEIASWLG